MVSGEMHGPLAPLQAGFAVPLQVGSCFGRLDNRAGRGSPQQSGAGHRYGTWACPPPALAAAALGGFEASAGGSSAGAEAPHGLRHAFACLAEKERHLRMDDEMARMAQASDHALLAAAQCGRGLRAGKASRGSCTAGRKVGATAPTGGVAHWMGPCLPAHDLFEQQQAQADPELKLSLDVETGFETGPTLAGRGASVHGAASNPGARDGGPSALRRPRPRLRAAGGPCCCPPAEGAASGSRVEGGPRRRKAENAPGGKERKEKPPGLCGHQKPPPRLL